MGGGGIENAKMQISIKISDPSVPRENAKGKCIVWISMPGSTGRVCVGLKRWAPYNRLPKHRLRFKYRVHAWGEGGREGE